MTGDGAPEEAEVAAPRRRRRSRSSRRDSSSSSSEAGPAALGAYLLAGLLILLPLARGGVDLWAEAVALGVASLALVLVAWREPRLPWAALPLVLVVLVTGAQVGLGLASGTAGGLGSLDPPSTARELGKAVAALAALLAAFALGPTRRKRDRVLLGLAISGLAVAAVVLGGALAGSAPLLNPTRPFVNPNHLSGFCSLTAFVILGIALRAHGQPRLLWLMGFTLVAAVAFLSLSRGGIVAFLGGAGLFVLLALWRQARPGEPPHRGRLIVVGTLAVALATVAYLALGPVLGELKTLRGAADEVKLDLWRPAFQMIRDRPLLGVGRGAFEVAFTAWKTQGDVVTFTHLENEWLHALVELGVPVGLLLVVTLGWLWLRVALRRDLSWIEVGLLAGTAAVAAQNLVDFSLELTGVAIPFAVALGLAQRGERAFALPRPALLGGVAALAAAAAGGLLLWRAHPLDEDAMSVAEEPSPEAAEARALALARWHPADWVPVATVGARWVESGRCAPAMPWLTRAMALNPTAGEPHLYAARCLAAAGQDAVAKREYRLAFVYGRGEALSEAGHRWDTVEDLLSVAPDSPDGLLAAAGVLAGQGRKDESREVLRRDLEQYADGRAVVPLTYLLIEARWFDEALVLARRRQVEAPLDAEGWRLGVELLSRLEREDEIEPELDRGLARLPASPPLVTYQVQRAMGAHRYSEAKRLAEGMAARTPAELAQRHAWIAGVLSAQGRLGEALEQARSAAAALPDAAWPLQSVSSYCEALGRWDDATAALEHAAALPGQDQAYWAPRLEKVKKSKEDALQRRQTERLIEGK